MCIHFKGTITVPKTGIDPPTNNRNKEVIFKNSAPVTNCINETNKTHIDNAKDLDVVMPMYSLLEHCENYSKNSGTLLQHNRSHPALKQCWQHC